ncbi:MAG: cation:proton antiporter [Polyangiaceae bacterium]
MNAENDIVAFLLALAILLGTARVLGELGKRVGFPAVAGELAAGVLLGPTVMGRVAPNVFEDLFGAHAPGRAMLSGYRVLASVLLLVVAGLEIDLSVVVRRRKEAAATSLAGIVLPMVLGVGLGHLLPDELLVDPSKRPLFAVFVGTALSISAMPVIAKTLFDLGLFKTDLGLLVMASAMVDDLVGWLLFSVIVGPMHGQAISVSSLALRVLGVLAFVVVALGLVRPLVNRVLTALERNRMSAAGRVLSLLVVLATLAAAFTQKIGIHAVFGAFIAGVAIGDSPKLRSETRSLVHEFVNNVFAPVFFAAVGLRVDFVGSFHPGLVAAVLGVACIAKIAGCTVGARATGLSLRAATAVGFAMNSRGAMEMILALVALEAGLIKPPFFVALVIMALVTSIMAGPSMNKLLRSRTRLSARQLVEEGAIVPALRARSAEQAVRELAHELATGTPLDGSVLADAVLESEHGSLGGLSDGIAIAHARVEGVGRSLLAVGRPEQPIDFDASDGIPARIVFLLVLPVAEGSRGVEYHAAIVRTVDTPQKRDRMLHATNRAEILAAMRTAEREAEDSSVLVLPPPSSRGTAGA